MVERGRGPSISQSLFTIRYSLFAIRPALKALMANWRTFVLAKMPCGLGAGHRARLSISAPGPERIRLRDMRTTIVLDPSRLKFACKIKPARCN